MRQRGGVHPLWKESSTVADLVRLAVGGAVSYASRMLHQRAESPLLLNGLDAARRFFADCLAETDSTQQIFVALAESHRKRHAVQVAAETRRGRVKVWMRIEPNDSRFGGFKSRQCRDATIAVARQHDRQHLLLACPPHGFPDLTADVDQCIKIRTLSIAQTDMFHLGRPPAIGESAVCPSFQESIWAGANGGICESHVKRNHN